MDFAKNAFWGWWVNLGLGICLVVSLTYGFWQGNRHQVEATKIQSDSKQVQTRIAFLEEQIRQAGPVSGFGSGISRNDNNSVFSNRQQIYDYFTNAAAGSGLDIQKIALRRGETGQGVITAEMEFSGNYPETQAFIQQIYAGDLQFVLEKVIMNHNPDPRRSLKLALLMNIAIAKGGS